MKLLVLDLDETLIFGTERELERPCDFIVGSYFVYLRPGLESLVNVPNVRTIEKRQWRLSWSASPPEPPPPSPTRILRYAELEP